MTNKCYTTARRNFLSFAKFKSLTFACLLCTGFLSTNTLAEDLSYAQAEQEILENSYTSQASEALSKASQLQSEAIKGLGLPRVDLNVRAYKFHSEVDIPLDKFKSNLEQTLSQGINDKLSGFEGSIPSGVLDPLQQGLNQTIHSGIGLFPDKSNVVLEDEVVKPSISVLMPLYTGGLISSSKTVANIKAERSQIDHHQQQDTQRFEMIQAYFNVQLQRQLLDASLFNYTAAQQHYDSALKLEKQGFISKGQRMQFEVARNNALRLLQNAQSNLQASQFTLNNLLNKKNIDRLSTPLFVNNQNDQSLQQLLQSYPEGSNLVKKLQMDTRIAEQNVKIQQAAKRPNLFAFGEYSLDDQQDWIVGVVAKYNIFDGVNKNKNMQAAELQRYASELMTARTKQEIENVIYKSFSEMTSAQQSQILLKQNILAATENLRIQELSYKEGMATPNQVIDAQNALMTVKTDMAINAFKYVISLATLLQTNGSISQFKVYTNQSNTDFIR
ncbi:TolC family protein [Acinetobacter gerneri]|uniref:TolC family protein n=1 Tax=Acinetobacter gerneri TaxID=202952 RepID=UPI0028A5CF50|nr:TolC family protein [Acinetobacter gerneri]